MGCSEPKGAVEAAPFGKSIGCTEGSEAVSRFSGLLHGLLRVWGLLLLGDGNGAFQVEGQVRPLRQIDLLVARESVARSAGSGSGQSADQGSFAAAGQPADQSTQPGAAAGEEPCAHAFTLLHAIDGGGGDRIDTPARLHTIQAHLQDGSALEAAERMGVNHRTLGASALGNDDLAVHHHIVDDRSGEGLAGLADL